MTPRTEPPFRADHVGSLLRPPALLAARAAHAAGEIDITRCVRPRTRRSGTPSRCRSGWACRRRPTASSGARRGTWTSSTGSAGSSRPTSASRCGCTVQPGDTAFTSAGIAVRSRVAARRADLRRRLPVPAETVTDRAAEADDPVAEHGPLPRRDGGGRPVVYPDLERVLGRPLGRLRRRGARARRPRLPLPAARRHEPGLPQRPRAARRDGRPRRGRRPPAPALHRADQRRAGRPAGRHAR